jgi:carbonic anhydrase/acetyltransferase-like protein (isoleucine patch superfamily)
MLLEHRGKRPRVHESAYVAPTATICGDVTIGENSRVLFGAVIVAEGGPVEIGAECIVMENAVIRGTRRHPTRIGNHVLVGPRAYLTGCVIEDNVFLATGATIFNGARIGTRAEVRINGVVHLKTNLPPDALVPIGWVAVGDPAEILPPHEHEKIWVCFK